MIGYLTSTLAPWSSSCFLSLAASSLFTPSLTVLPPASTRSLASLRPRPVIARTSLMTLIFFSPLDLRTTANSVFSSAAGAAPAAGAEATATGAAAETPHFSSRSLASSAASKTVSFERSSTIFPRSAMTGTSFALNSVARCAPASLARAQVYGLPHSGAAGSLGTFGALRLEHARQLGARLFEHARDLGCRRLHQADELGPQLVERRQVGQRLDGVGVHDRRPHRSAQDHELVVLPGILDRDPRGAHGVARKGDAGLALEKTGGALGSGAFQRQHGETVLGDLDCAAGFFHALAKLGHLRDSHARVVGNYQHAAVLPCLIEGGNELAFLCSIHCLLTPSRGMDLRWFFRGLHLAVARDDASPVPFRASATLGADPTGADRRDSHPRQSSPVSCWPSGEA